MENGMYLDGLATDFGFAGVIECDRCKDWIKHAEYNAGKGICEECQRRDEEEPDDDDGDLDEDEDEDEEFDEDDEEFNEDSEADDDDY